MAQPQPKHKEILLNVIKLYKDMPFLWDKNHKNYKNKDVRNNGNNMLLDIYKGFDSNASLKALVKKIQNLRTGYFKELKRVRESIRSGAGADEIYEPTLWYFDAMSFLGTANDTCSSVRDTMKMEDASSSSSDELHLQDSHSNSESLRRSRSSSISRRKKKRFLNDNLIKKRESVVDTAGKLVHMKSEEWEIIGKGIGLQLKDLDKRQFFIAQKIIHDTIYYAQMGLLTENSSVTGFKQT